MTLLTAMTTWAGEYTYNSETHTLTLVSGEFNKDNKWSVSSSAVFSVIATNQVRFTGDCSELFSGFSNCTSMDLDSVNTSTVTNMSNMFQNCSSLTTLKISNWNTCNVTNMSYMFQNCSSLTTFEISDWNTCNVTNMSNMFSDCVLLTSLDLSGWNTENVTDMSYMFQRCSKLTSPNISSWNTANVTNMNFMFFFCANVITVSDSTASLDLSGWDTGNVTSMMMMFEYCGYNSLNLSGWNMGKVINMTSMFTASKVTSVDLSGWNNINQTLTSIFVSNFNLNTVNLTGWDISNVKAMNNMFAGCYNLTTIYASTSWDAGNVNVIGTNNMFDNCTSLVGGMGTTFDSNYTDKTYARIDRGAEQPGYFTGVFTLTLPTNVTASPNPICTLGDARYFKAGSTIALTYNGTVPQGKMVVYSVNGTPVEGNTFQMPLDDVTVTVTFRDLPTEIAVGDITFNMIKVEGNNDISTFYIGECEVTEALWLAVMGGNNPSSNPGNLQDNLPVENITWNDCQAFVAKLNVMTGYTFRLPTIAEWLYASSGGNYTHGYTYSGSNTIGDVAWYAGNCEQKQPVGTKAANELGIHDMSGNVYEIIDEATGVYGGGWHAPANHCRANYCWGADSTFKDDDTGFRLALTKLDVNPVALRGDLNDDGKVDVDDLNICISIILGANNDPDAKALADLNADGAVDINDVNALINIILQ